MNDMPQLAVDQVCATWARILERRHPELGRIEVSPVDRASDPTTATSGKVDVLPLPHDQQATVKGRRAA